jgi:hypothetical protein
MLRAIAGDAIEAARRHGAESAVFGGYRIAARRVGTRSASGVVLTLGVAPSAPGGTLPAVRTAVAPPAAPDAASVIAWRCPGGRAVGSEVPTAG